MRIGVDMDGVLADFDRGWTERYNADFGTNLKPKHNDHWDALITLTGLTYDEWWEWAQSKHEDLFLSLPALPGSIRGMWDLREDGHEICIITAKPRWAAGHPSSWLIKHNIPYDEIHVTSKKQYVVCDVYVDDALHNVVDLLENTDARVIQYAAYPYVNGGERVEGAIYATSWDDVVREVRSWQRFMELVGSQGAAKTRRLKRSWRKEGLNV